MLTHFLAKARATPECSGQFLLCPTKQSWLAAFLCHRPRTPRWAVSVVGAGPGCRARALLGAIPRMPLAQENRTPDQAPRPALSCGLTCSHFKSDVAVAQATAEARARVASLGDAGARV